MPSKCLLNKQTLGEAQAAGRPATGPSAGYAREDEAGPLHPAGPRLARQLQVTVGSPWRQQRAAASCLQLPGRLGRGRFLSSSLPPVRTAQLLSSLPSPAGGPWGHLGTPRPESFQKRPRQQPKWPSMDGWMNQRGTGRRVEYYSATKRNESTLIQDSQGGSSKTR